MKTLRSEKAIVESLQLIDKVFRGSLIIQASDFLKWKLYFRLGRLSWVTGGVNSNERLQRHLATCCPLVTKAQLKQIPLEHQPYREQHILVNLQGQGLIQRNQMANLMESIATEVLFDAIQYGETSENNLSCHQVSEEQNDSLLLLLPFLDINTVLARAKQKWEEWENAGLTLYSPNLYPVIQQPNLLKTLIKNNLDRQIISSADGSQSLRNIAAKNKISVLKVTLFFLSLAQSKAINFSKISKQKSGLESLAVNQNTIENKIKIKNNVSKKDNIQPNQQPLIVCVDDSPLICKAVKDIVLQHKLRFLEIQEPIKVIPTLLRNKPDLIFLDLMMPIINGYELCGQLRKTPSFKDIPIIILTGKDGLIDRMRAKLVGSTDFLPKPVEKEILLKMLEKYLNVNQLNHE